jgi:uncharacterized membrane protein YkvA (DUF1232 family)
MQKSQTDTRANGVLAGFPREEFSGLVRRLPSYARLAWALARDPRLSRARRAAVLAGAAYVLSPIDLVPGIIPVAGQLDDVAVALGAIRIALGGLKPEYRAKQLAAAGLSQAQLDADLKATGTVAWWIGKSGVRVAAKIVTTTAATASDVGRALYRRIRPPRGDAG